jgi:hypothetical protein
MIWYIIPIVIIPIILMVGFLLIRQYNLNHIQDDMNKIIGRWNQYLPLNELEW